jgi:hypothetical protein
VDQSQDNWKQLRTVEAIAVGFQIIDIMGGQLEAILLQDSNKARSIVWIELIIRNIS